MRDRGIRGLTSNPTIFQKAIQGSSDYDEQFTELAADQHPVLDDYWEMVFADIHGACDVLDPVYDRVRRGRRLRVGRGRARASPTTSRHRRAAARDLHRRLDRRNLMVKIPATAEGVPAIRQMISEGRNINVTLIFSLDRYADVMEAYIGGLEAYAADPDADLSRVASVGQLLRLAASTPRSTAGSRRSAPAGAGVAGKAAVAQGKLAYKQFAETFQRRALGRARCSRRRRAAPAVGEHRHQEPGLLRHALRRPADRPRHGQHPDRGDDRSLPRPRHGAARSTPTSTRRSRCGRRWQKSASTWTSQRDSSAKASTPSPRASTN